VFGGRVEESRIRDVLKTAIRPVPSIPDTQLSPVLTSLVSSSRGVTLKSMKKQPVIGTFLSKREASSHAFKANIHPFLFRSAEISETGLTCWHCHANFNEKKAPDDYVRPGHPMHNVRFRSAFRRWDKTPQQTLEDAIATCMIRWMTGRNESGYNGKPAPVHRVRQLSAYLKSEEISPELKSKPIEPLMDEKMPSDRMLALGDAAFGGVVFRQSCGICHKDEGTGPGPSLIKNGYSRYQIAKKVRGLGKRGLNGLMMPPFSKDRVSDRQLLNVVAYVYQL
jgi:cytochrome c5